MEKPPNSYKDPYWVNVASVAESKVGIPAGLLTSIFQHGEKSNNDQVSSADARTPFQIIKPTRDLFLKKYGVDAYLSPENAAEVGALHLKESLDRNKGDVALAAAEYHAGPNRKNWGPITEKYVQRVTSGFSQTQTKINNQETESNFNVLNNDFAKFMQANPATGLSKQVENKINLPEGLNEGFGKFLISQQNQPDIKSNPVDGMSTFDKLAAGAGAGLTSAGAGIKQLIDIPAAYLEKITGTENISKSLGMPTAQQAQSDTQSFIDENKRLDAPLLDTTAGQIGNIVGQVAPAVLLPNPSTLGGAAALGAAQGFAQPVATGESRIANTAIGGLAGGVFKGASDLTKAAFSAASNKIAQKSTQNIDQSALIDITKKAASGSEKQIDNLAQASAPNSKTIDAANRLNFEYQPDHVTTNQTFREMAQALKSVPGSEARAAELNIYAANSKKADDLIKKLGGTEDLSGLSSGIKKELEKTHFDLKSSAKKIYDEIDQNLLQKKVESPAPTVLKLIEQRAETLGGSQFLTKGEKLILNRLAPSDEGVHPTYALLDETRKQIGAAKRGAQNAFGSADSKLLGDLESALREDQKAVVSAHGLGQKWEDAQALAKSYKGVQSNLEGLFGKSLENNIVGKLTKSVRELPTGKTTDFINLIKSIPEGMREETVASGLNAAFGKTLKNNDLSYTSYSNWYEGILKNKQAHTAIMTNLPTQARKQLSDLYRVSKSISEASRERITTGRLNSAPILKELEGPNNLMTKIYQYAKPAAAGAAASLVAGPAIGAAVGAALSKGARVKGATTSAADKLIASPEFASAVADAARGENKKATLKLVKSSAFKQYASKIPNVSNWDKWIITALEKESNKQSNGK